MRRAFGFCLLAAAVPCVTLWYAAPEARAARGMAVAPFGWPSLLVVHSLAAVVAAVLSGHWLGRKVPQTGAMVWAGIGLAFAFVGYLTVGSFAEFLDAQEAGFSVRSFVRSVFCFFLALPWCLAVPLPLKPQTLRLAIPTAVISCFVLPGIWAHRVGKETAEVAVTAMSERRITRAHHLLEGLCDLDPRWGIADGSKNAVQLRHQLAMEEKELQVYLAQTDPTSLPLKQKMYFANGLLSLDRPAEAEAILREVAPRFPPANLPLARALHQQGKYDESDAAVRDLLVAARPELQTSRNVSNACREGFDLMAENATKRGANTEREAVLQEALTTLPTEQAYYRFQLGRHYRLVGRPHDAVREITAAMKLDKRYAPPGEALLREIREQTPACLLGR